MVLKKIAVAIMIMSLTSGGFAESFADRPDLGRNDRGQRDNRYDNRGPRDGRHDGDFRGPGSARPGRPAGRDSWGDHRFDPGRRYHRGERLPLEYRGRNYVVEDWRGHHLSAPPRGYHWVQSGTDYLLVAIATGIILQAITNR